MTSQRDEMFFTLEQKLAQVAIKLSAEDASSIIAEDFVEFGASGRVWTKTEIIAAMSSWEPMERRIENFDVRELSPCVCLITYKTIELAKGRRASLRSSIWRYIGEKWEIIFHRGTSSAWMPPR
jgi:hypothetical protein